MQQNTNISIAELFKEQEAKLIKAKSAFFFRESWFGTLISKFNFHLIELPAIPTACIDKNCNVFFNVHFLASLKAEQIIFLIGHELLHYLLQHFNRKGDRDAKRWNVACDYVVNNLLIDFKLGEVIEGAYFNESWLEYTAEQIYKKLDKEDAEKQTLDEHFDIDNTELTKALEQLAKGFGDSPDKDLKHKEEQIQKQFEGLRDSLFDEPKPWSKHIRKHIQLQSNFTTSDKAQIAWATVLKDYLQQTIWTTANYLKPQKKTLAYGINLPTYNEVVSDAHLAIAIDMSESMEKEWVDRFLNEIANILQDIKNITIDIWGFSDKLINPQRLQDGEVESLSSYQLEADGRTYFEINWQHIEEQNLNADAIIILTDGQPSGSWGSPTYSDKIIFVVIADREIKPPFGKVFYID